MNALILIIDDDQANRISIARVLEKAGYKVIEADSGATGFCMAREHKPDLLLLDVNLPDMSGPQVCQQIKAEAGMESVFVVLFSGSNTDSDSQSSGLEAGADGFITQPITNRELLARLEAMLRIRFGQEALRTALNKTQAIFNAIQDGITLADFEGHIVEANEAAAVVHGFTNKDEYLQTNIIQLVAENEIQRLQEDAHQIFENGGSLVHEYELRRKDGSSFDGQIRLSRMEIGPQGQPLILAATRDVTEQRQAQEAVRKSEERYRGLFENMVEGYSLCQMIYENGEAVDWIYLAVNQAFETLTGLKEVTGKPVSVVIPGLRAEDPDLFNIYGRVARTGRPEKFEMFIKTLQMWFSVSVYSPERSFFVAVFDVITDQKIAEQALREYSEQLEKKVEERSRALRDTQEELVRNERLAVLGQLTSSVGHELRNPLSVISNAVYYLRLVQPQADEKVVDYLNILQTETRRAEKIITDLLDFSRSKTADCHPLDVTGLINQTLERFPVPEGIHLAFQPEPDLPLIYADPFQMLQVFGNLIVNACQAMPDGGALTIKAQRSLETVALSISDTGAGIAPENMKKLFEPLFTTKPRGIGLGLAICKKWVEVNNGRIEVQSELGKGSTFTILLPISNGANG